MIAAVKRTATITDEEINEMTDELMEMYPAAVAVYYEGCIQAIREKARKLDNNIHPFDRANNADAAEI